MNIAIIKRIFNIKFTCFIFLLLLSACKSDNKKPSKDEIHNTNVKIVGAMKNVMWNSELGSAIDLDSLSQKNNLYGLGPLSNLQGEIMINDGDCYVAKATSDTSMKVEKTYQASAPFFVYENVDEWKHSKLQDNIKTIKDLEDYIDTETNDLDKPFAFKLNGRVKSAKIHIQNLPEGTHVSSPEVAHKSQIDFTLKDQDVYIVGFFSKEHQGVFTHHDSFLHMHLLTRDESKMGHLDEVEFGEMQLFLPIQ